MRILQVENLPTEVLPTQQVIEVAKGISDYGAVVILAAVMILFMIYTFFEGKRKEKNRDSLLDSLLKDRQEELQSKVNSIEKFSSETAVEIKQLFDGISNFVSTSTTSLQRLTESSAKIQELLIEMTSESDERLRSQMRAFSIALFKVSRYRLIEELSIIAEVNHVVENEAFVRNKLRGIITNIHEERNDQLDTFPLFKGKKLTAFVSEKWIDDCLELCMNILLQGFAWKTAKQQLSSFYDGISYLFIRKLK
jgi:hypothetical protein